MSFDAAVSHVLKWEGGTVNHPNDPGGLTRYGISQRAYPQLDIAALTEAGARAIYRRDYWNRLRADELPAPVALTLFDCAVNTGVTQAVKFLQRAVEVHVDGILGPVTLAAAKAADPHDVVRDLTTERLLFYVSLPTFATFGRGWLRRSIDTARIA